MSANRLLIVDDEIDIGRLIESVATAAGFEVIATTDVDEFRERAQAWQPTHIVLDLHMPGTDGIEVLRFLAEWQCDAQVVIASGFDSKIIESARQIGIERGLTIAGTLSKPIRLDALKQLLAKIRTDEFTVDVAAIENAIARDELTLHFQPKVKIAGNGASGPAWTEVAGFEALLRWQHPTAGFVPPGDFIPVAEATGSMERLTAKVIELALASAQEWECAGYDISVSVNVSAEDLYDIGVADSLAARCAQAGLAPHRVVIELTETAAMRDVTIAMDILTRLRIKGFNLSMDDFGTGYSSLVQLQRMPFSELKIDRMFFRDGLRSDQDLAIVKTMIDLGHNLGLTVVAEGVETEDVLRRLSELGCDVAQGYHIARPMPAAEVLKWLRKV